MKIPMVKGRMFSTAEFALEDKTEDDPKAGAKVVTPAVVNESFVKAYFAKVDPFGQPFGADSPAMSGNPHGRDRRVDDRGCGARRQIQ
jgi:hypothetical protein